MATINPTDELPSSSLAEETESPNANSNPDEAESGVPDSTTGADAASDLAQLDLEQPKDDTDFTALQYPAIDMPMEPSSNIVIDAADLSASDWAALIKRHQLLYGFSIREQAQDVVRSREQAFILRGRQSSLGIGGINASQAIIPDFQIEDGSSIQVRETKNKFQRQLALKSFSARCIESNLSAGDFGIMAGFTGSRSKSISSSETSHNVARSQEYYALFNFPRARLMLDEENLQLSDKCRDALLEIQTQPTYNRLQRFYKIFGHVFVTSLVLGGQQRTSKYAASLEINNEEVQQDALRGAIGVNVNAQYLAASVKKTTEHGKSESRNDKKYSDLSYLGMSAIGGDPLIGSDVPKWAGTVAPWKNWRVIEHEIAVPIHELIGLIPSYDHVPELFKTIMKNRSSANRPWKGSLTLLLNNQPLRWRLDDKSLCPIAASNNNTTKEPVFHVLSAATRAFDHRAEVQELRADWPYHLFTSTAIDQSDISGSDEHGFYSMFVGSDGSLKPPGVAPGDLNRFSFRLAGTTGKWNPARNPPLVIKSGDQVNIYCHSVGVGPYRSILKPPAEASPVMYDPFSETCRNLFVPVHRAAFESPDRDLIQKYDNGTLSEDSKSAFEKMGLITSRELAPGPIELVETTRKLGVGPLESMISTSKEYTLIDGKRETIDYKKLQKPKYDRLDLDWGYARRSYILGAAPDMRIRQPATFTVLFE